MIVLLPTIPQHHFEIDTTQNSNSGYIAIFSYVLAMRVYNTMMKKTCNGIFENVLRNYCEQRSLRDKIQPYRFNE